ncbi:isotocin-neurophysin IT 2-like [Ornithodoros turicata]|uniref:isotocin-neurophysin IT 2-like n=1 Tax=Ornithodoros turicata TaxID=34597 RepID=UPI003139EFB5
MNGPMGFAASYIRSASGVLLRIRSTVHTCFITNCPPGGKRASEPISRMCPRCGPGNRGICYGPNVCCTGISCLMNENLESCRAEALRGRLCHVPGKACGAQGRCALRGFCCQSDGCKKDDSCDSQTMKETLFWA